MTENIFIANVDSANGNRTSGNTSSVNRGTVSESDRELVSELEESILTMLLGRQMYGLEMSKEFERLSGGRRKVGPGTLYPALARLEDRGYLESTIIKRPQDSKGGARRKYFKITKKGAIAIADAELFRQRLNSSLAAAY